MHYILDYLGYIAPIIMAVISYYLFLGKPIYTNYFFAGLVANNIINIILKLLIKEPRPNNEFKKVELAVKHGEYVYFDKFGMPSAHLQNSLYILGYTLFVLGPTKFSNMIILYIMLVAICGYQRYTSKNHTILQIGIGSVIGFIVAIITYFFASKQVKGQIEEKQDDNGPL
uniref:Phosphatidic acid phosphatase type 2/haloperoxidase domain-containing protein n=1 Tax=viral metagenome TaxID=1070528 RepID=A0A6C0IVK9_9ZZZZ